MMSMRTKSLRQQFADTMLDVGKQDKSLVVMVGDISHGILQPFSKAYPNRYYNVGICEPTIVNMGAGLSKVGLTPVLHTISPFLIQRSYEQIKLDYGYQNLPVNLISVGGSFDYAQLGCSHHTYADVSMMCHFKRANVFVPGSALEFDSLFKQVYKNNSINYYRLPNNPHGIEFNPSDIQSGKAIKVREGNDITMVTMGTHLKTVLAVADKLSSEGKSTEVLYYHSIKPFDYLELRKSVEKTGRVLSIEELSAHDGLYNQVLKACIGLSPIVAHQIAVEDFIHGYGNYKDLCEKVGLTEPQIFKTAIKLLETRNG